MIKDVQIEMYPNEQIQFTGKRSVWSLWPWMLFKSVCMFIGVDALFQISSFSEVNSSIHYYALAIVLVCSILALLQSQQQLILTNQRLILQGGFRGEDVTELFFAEVVIVETKSSLLGDAAKYGNVYAIGRGCYKKPFYGLHNVEKFQRRYYEVQQQYLKC